MRKIIYLNFLLTILFFTAGKFGFAQTDTTVSISDTINYTNDTIPTSELAGLKENTISLLFIGDIMGHGPQIRSAYDAKTKKYNYDTVFYYLKNRE